MTVGGIGRHSDLLLPSLKEVGLRGFLLQWFHVGPDAPRGGGGQETGATRPATPPPTAREGTNNRGALDELLAEEGPEQRLGPTAERDAEFQGAEPGGYVLLAETEDTDQDGGSDDLAAQDAAVHVTDK